MNSESLQISLEKCGCMFIGNDFEGSEVYEYWFFQRRRAIRPGKEENYVA